MVRRLAIITKKREGGNKWMSRLPYLGVFSSKGCKVKYVTRTDKHINGRTTDYGSRTDGRADRTGVSTAFFNSTRFFFYVAWTDWTGGLAL